MLFDLRKWNWQGGGPLHSYTTKLGRNLCHPRLQLAKPIHLKWQGLVEANFIPNWNDVWRIDRPQKEAGFFWSILYNAVAVNSWRNRIFPNTLALCTLCNSGLPESCIHVFYDCAKVADMWELAFLVLYLANSIATSLEPWRWLSWRQCFVGSPLPRHLNQLQDVWSLIQGTVLWFL
jgi:hypothetical protein